HARRYNLAGVSQSDEFLVNSSTEGWQDRSAVASSPSGDFVIAWSGEGQGDEDIFAQRYAVVATVSGRYVFYNDSFFDGNDPAAAGAADDAAIATDKSALLPGQTATGVNLTSYSNGINGVMIDIAGLANPAGLSKADFTFRAGIGGDPSTWSAAPEP